MQNDYEILLRFLLAALWGGIVGAERQYRSKSAGFRTMIMISMGACFFTITTAATIWAVAAVGMGIGSGFYFASSCASILIFLILAVLPFLENYIELLNVARTYAITVPYTENLSAHFEKSFKNSAIKYRLVKHIKDNGFLVLVWETQGHAKNHDKFIAKMLEDDSLNKFEYY